MSSLFKSSQVKTTQEQKGTSTQEGKLTPAQELVNSALFKQILAAVEGGPQPSQLEKNVGRTGVNDAYDAAGKNVEANLAARGFSGPNGKLGQGYGGLAIARNKAMAQSDLDVQNTAMQRFQQMIGNAFQFDQPRSYTTNSSGTATNTQPGPSIFDRILGYAGQGIGGAVGMGWQPFR